MTTASTTMSKAMRDKRFAVGLILVMLALFYAVSIGVEYVQSSDHGYGSGFSNQYHVPQSVIKQVSVEDHISIPANVTAKQLSNMTLGNHGGGVWHDVWRWVLTVGVLLFLLWFWWTVCSKVGLL
jgi:hypothetical protein